MLNLALVALTFLVCFTSCKKDKLTGGYAELGGEWEWLESTGGESGNLLVTPVSSGIKETIFFKEQGRYKRITQSNEDGKKSERGRILIEKSNSQYYDFLITLQRDYGLYKDFPNKVALTTSSILETILKNDTLFLYPYGCNDCLVSIYIKK